MSKSNQGIIFGIAMVVLIVSLDLLFFRHHTTERLLLNVGTVLVFIAFYLRLKNKH